MYKYKLSEITFNDGTKIAPGNLTVIVGPNNTGKSRALKEIAAITTGESLLPKVIVTEVIWPFPPSVQELRDAYDIERYQDERGNWTYRVLNPQLLDEASYSGGPEWPNGYTPENFHSAKGPNYLFFAQQFGKAMIAFLNTENRLLLVKESETPSHERQVSKILHAIYNAGRSREKEVRELTKRAFGQEIALDFTVLQRILLRVGADFSTLPPDPRDAKPILSIAEKLDDQGDGFRSFVGIVVGLMSLRRDVFLIDEPEAFLHPPQAFRIGEFLSDQATKSRQIILATHSADVLRGILSKTQDVSIIRIDRTGEKNNFNVLDPQRLKEIVTDPLLSSARVLDGLFYSGAVVVEGQSDARFYHAVSNRRLPESDLHFVNADNKQTVPRITTLYRDMGIRCVGVVDFDALNDHNEFRAQLKTIGLDESATSEALAIQKEIATVAKQLPAQERLDSVKQQLSDLLTAVEECRSRSYSSESQAASEQEKVLLGVARKSSQLADSTKAWKDLKQRGRAALPGQVQVRFDELWKACISKGLVINPTGELESLLVEHGIHPTTDKRGWIVQALQLIPSLQVDDTKYPWKLMSSIHRALS